MSPEIQQALADMEAMRLKREEMRLEMERENDELNRISASRHDALREQHRMREELVAQSKLLAHRRDELLQTRETQALHERERAEREQAHLDVLDRIVKEREEAERALERARAEAHRIESLTNFQRTYPPQFLQGPRASTQANSPAVMPQTCATATPYDPVPPPPVRSESLHHSSAFATRPPRALQAVTTQETPRYPNANLLAAVPGTASQIPSYPQLSTSYISVPLLLPSPSSYLATALQTEHPSRVSLQGPSAFDTEEPEDEQIRATAAHLERLKLQRARRQAEAAATIRPREQPSYSTPVITCVLHCRPPSRTRSAPARRPRARGP